MNTWIFVVGTCGIVSLTNNCKSNTSYVVRRKGLVYRESRRK